MSFVLFDKRLTFLFVLCSVFFCLVFSSGTVRAYLAPQIFVTDLKINSAENGEIKGEFKIWNSETFYLTDIGYAIKLFKGADLDTLKLVDISAPEEKFFVAPDQTVTKYFSYKYPQNIISGDYTLRLQITTQRGSELGWKDQVISLHGNGNFLEIDQLSPRVFVDDKEYYPQEGPSVSTNQAVEVFLKVMNSGDSITVVPHLKIFDRQYNLSLYKEYDDVSISFPKGQTKEIILQMPKINSPGVYLAELKFYQSGNQVSGVQYFRWVVSGEGGKILYLKADKDYFKAGENMNLTVETIGPADGNDLGQGKLDVSVFDENRNVIGTASKEVPLNAGLVASVISIPIERDLILPTVNAKLTKDGNILDEQIINLPIFSNEAKKIQKWQIAMKFFKNYFVYFLLILIIIFILIFWIVRKRKIISRF